MLEDIAVLTNGTVISEDIGIKLEDTTLDMLGSAGRVIITKDHTTIVEGAGSAEDIAFRCDQIRANIKAAHSDYEIERFEERLAKLAGGVAVIRVGAPSEMEMKEKKDRVDDALHATRAAIDEGIVAGGGSALLFASRALASLVTENEEQNVGVQIVRRALQAPVRQIAQNAGFEGAVVAGKLLEQAGSDQGFNAQTGEYVNMIEDGIIDPTKVVRIALQDAASVAGLLITTEVMIATAKDDAGPSSPMGGAGGMDGMF
jgi:chaperonin GroEL